jgi:hypothetical protein
VGRPYLTANTLSLRYREHPVNAVWGNSRCFLSEPYGTQIHCVGRPYLTANTLSLRYREHPVNAVWGNSRCLLSEPHGTYRHTVWADRTSQQTHYVSATESTRLMLFEETVAVCFENHKEHSHTMCGLLVCPPPICVWACETARSGVRRQRCAVRWPNNSLLNFNVF